MLPKLVYLCSLVTLGGLGPAVAPAGLPLGTAFTYQGQLTEDGTPVTNPTQDMRFRLYDAAVGGTQVGADFVPAGGVDVHVGLFTVQLDFGIYAFAGEKRWLEIAVFKSGTGYVTLSPRQELTATPYALWSALPWTTSGTDIYYLGEVGIGVTSPSYQLEVSDVSADPTAFIRNTGTGPALRAEGVASPAILATGANNAVEAWAAGTTGVGVFGGADAATGVTRGVEGYVVSPSGTGVYGRAIAVTGAAHGVYGKSYSASGAGVYGDAAHATGVNYGGYFLSASSSGYGVFGKNTSTGTNDSPGVYGEHAATDNWGIGVSGKGGYRGVVGTVAPTGTGTYSGVYGSVSGSTGHNRGVHGSASGGTTSYGVYGDGTTAGVYGQGGYGGRFKSTSVDGVGALGEATNDNGDGLYGLASGLAGIGVQGASTHTSSTIYGWGGYFTAASDAGTGVFGQATATTGSTYGGHFVTNSAAGYGVLGENTADGSSAVAIYGYNAHDDGSGVGVKGVGGYRGVEGRAEITGSSLHYGVYGYAANTTGTAYGVRGAAAGTSTNYGVYGTASGGTTNYAGYFNGNVNVTGTLSKGGGSFKIDHPLDPANKYLYHSFVESPDMMNIYNGNVTLNASGEALVTMPEWFEALNRDFRYQLTCIGGFAPVFIAEEIKSNQFKIAGGTPGLKVSWQVTGVRHDPFANANRVPVEIDKPESERGTYLHPEAAGLPTDLQVDRVREAAEEATADAAQPVGD